MNAWMNLLERRSLPTKLVLGFVVTLSVALVMLSACALRSSTMVCNSV